MIHPSLLTEIQIKHIYTFPKEVFSAVYVGNTNSWYQFNNEYLIWVDEDVSNKVFSVRTIAADGSLTRPQGYGPKGFKSNWDVTIDDQDLTLVGLMYILQQEIR